jgi:hypothetical protein
MLLGQEKTEWVCLKRKTYFGYRGKAGWAEMTLSEADMLGITPTRLH